MADDTLTLKVNFSEIDRAVAGAIKQFESLAVNVTSKLRTVSVNAIKDFGTISAGITESLRGVTTFVKGVFTTDVGESFKNVANGAKEAFAQVALAAVSPLAKIKSLFGSVFGGLLSPIKMVVSGISSVFGTILAPVKMAFGAVASVVKSVFSGIYNTVKGVFSSIVGFIQGSVSRIADVIKSLLPLVGIGLFAGLVVGFQEFIQTEDAMSRVAASVEATGRAAGYTAEQLQMMAEEMSATTRFGDDAILNAQNIMLAFRNIRGEEFARAMKVSADAAIKGGEDITTSAEKIARALDDPLEGFRMLKAWGVKFSEQERMNLESMMEFNRGAEAQAFILSRLEEVLGGQAARDVNTFGGALAQTNNAMGDMWKMISGSLVPIVKDIAAWFKRGAEAVQEWGPALDNMVERFRTWAADTSKTLQKWWDDSKVILTEFGDKVIEAMTTAAAFIKTAFQDPAATFAYLKSEALLAFDTIQNKVLDVFDIIVEKGKSAWSVLLDAFDERFGESADLMLRKAQQAFVNMNKFNPIAKAMGHQDMTDQDVEEQVAIDKRTRALNRERKQALEESYKRNNMDPVTGKPLPEGGKSSTELAREKVMAERAARTKELQDEADKQRGLFGARMAPNKTEANEFVRGIKDYFKGLGGDGDKLPSPKPDVPLNNRIFNKDAKTEGGSAGKFEDLTSLQKRIQGAAAQGGSPEVRAIAALTKEQKKSVALQQKAEEREARREKQRQRQLEIQEKILKLDEANAGQGALIA